MACRRLQRRPSRLCSASRRMSGRCQLDRQRVVRTTASRTWPTSATEQRDGVEGCADFDSTGEEIGETSSATRERLSDDEAAFCVLP